MMTPSGSSPGPDDAVPDIDGAPVSCPIGAPDARVAPAHRPPGGWRRPRCTRLRRAPFARIGKRRNRLRSLRLSSEKGRAVSEGSPRRSFPTWSSLPALEREPFVVDLFVPESEPAQAAQDSGIIPLAAHVGRPA